MMNDICFICGIATGTVKYITERRQIQFVCEKCNRGLECDE